MVAPRSPTNLPMVSLSLFSSMSVPSPVPGGPAVASRRAAACADSRAWREAMTYGKSPMGSRGCAISSRHPGGHPGPAGHAEAGHHVAHVELGRLLTDAELATDLPVRAAGCHQGGDLVLA